MKTRCIGWCVFGYYCLLFYLNSVVRVNVRAAGLPLNDFIAHFEPLYYDNEQFRHMHQRTKRSNTETLNLKFFAHNRLFKMRLKRDESIFADDVIIESTDGPVAYDVSRIFSGHLEDDEASVIGGILTTDGLFDGDIMTSRGDEFYIEPAARYLSKSADFHSVIYRSSDVKMPPANDSCRAEAIRLNCSTAVPAVRRRRHRRGHRSKTAESKKRRRKYDGHLAPRSGSRRRKTKMADGDEARLPSPVMPDFISPVAAGVAAQKKFKNIYSALNREPSLSRVDTSAPTGGNSKIGSNSRVSIDKNGNRVNKKFAKLVITNEPYDNPLFFDTVKTANKIDSIFVLKNSRDQALPDVDEAAVPRTSPPLGGSEPPRVKGRTKPPPDGWLPPPSTVKDRWKRSSLPYDYELRFMLGDSPTPDRLQVPDTFQQKRAVIDTKKTTCMLYLQADHLFYQRLGSIEACIETMTRHVQKVNNIYKVTDFDQDGQPDNISFMIKRIKVHTMEALRDPVYRFPGNYGVEKFLELFSEEDYDAFCLAYMFTYRDFEGGTLGLAWTGDLKNAGGVCEKNGHYRGSLKSLNTGIVTLLNYGKHVPPAVSHVTLAHEIGHNFGSPHDPEDNRACTPSGEDGNYIMFARATSGDKKNNNKFSPCSLRSINAVLNTKARGNKGCFTEPQDSICGNEVVEKGEECDCGWEEDCEEVCCFPMRANAPKDEPPCKLRPNKTCSPSQGPCCGQECMLQVGTKCRDDNGCRDASYCDGVGPKCPPSTNKPNKTVCNDEFVCYMGECTGSICIAYGLEPCQCRREIHDPVTKACELCCKGRGEDQQCLSSFSWNHPPYDIPDMFAKPGTPCDNYNGYCDMFQKCREVDPSGPLATLRQLLLSTESIASLKRWIVEHWWGVLFMVVGFLIIMIVIVKIFGKNPDSKAKQVATVTGQFAGSNNLAFTATPQHAIATTVSRTNLPVTTTTATSAANGRPFGMTPNGWV